MAAPRGGATAASWAPRERRILEVLGSSPARDKVLAHLFYEREGGFYNRTGIRGVSVRSRTSKSGLCVCESSAGRVAPCA
eukprot:COSAG02_NODE_7109_length_3180_cov_1.805258_2_plen_80_part_00